MLSKRAKSRVGVTLTSKSNSPPLVESPHVVPLPPFYIQNPLKSWIPEIYILEKVEPSVGCTIVEHLNCTAHNGLWMDWRNNPNHSNGPGRVLCTSKKHHFWAFLGVLFIEIDSSFWKIFSQNFRGELPHIESLALLAGSTMWILGNKNLKNTIDV